MKLDRKPTLDALCERDDFTGKRSQVLRGTRIDVGSERGQILRMNIDSDFVKDVFVEEVVGCLAE
jgi:hypothetical protein